MPIRFLDDAPQEAASGPLTPKPPKSGGIRFLDEEEPQVVERPASVPVQSAPPEVQREVEAHTAHYDTLAASRFSPERLEEMKKKGPIGFFEAPDFLEAQDVLPGGGIGTAYDIGVIMSAGEKIKKGEELSIGEEETLNSYIDKNIEMNVRGMSVPGQVSYYGAQMPAFMIEFAATGGVGKLASKAVEGVAKKGALAAVAKTSANIAARTAVLPTMYVPKYAELRMNDFMALTDKGSVIFKESKESPAKSALKAFGHTAAEVASELAGSAVSRYLVSPLAGAAGRYLKTPMVTAASKLPHSVKTGIYEAYKVINPNARVSKIFTAGGWNGMIEEMGEERLADVLHATLDMATDKEYTWEDYVSAITPSKDQLLVEAGIVGIMGGVRSSANIAMNILSSQTGDGKVSRETVDNMSASEQDAFAEDAVAKMARKPDVDAASFSEEVSQKYGIDVALHETGDRLHLASIKVPEGERSKGVGTSAMADIIQYAERTGKDITLTPTTDFGATDIKRLESFYKNMGFVENTDSASSERFVRPSISADPISKAQMQAAAKADPPQINTEESGYETFYREFFDRLQPIEKLTKRSGQDLDVSSDPNILARTYAGMIGNVQHNLKYGTTRLNPETGQVEVTGKSLKSIMDDLDASIAHIEGSRDARAVDFEDFLIARRTLSDLMVREDVKVSEADKLKSAKTMSALADKYGQDLGWLDTFAKELYDYQKRVLYNLVEAGNMSQETYDGILKKNPNYIPFQRVMDDAEKVYGLTSRGVFTDAKPGKVIKKIKGSEREIKNVGQSIVANTARIIELAHRNRVALAVADLSETMPEYVQKAEAIQVKRGTAKVKVTYDAGLRRKLEAAITAFGNTVEYKQNLKVKGQGFVRGSYSPMEKTVRMRIGSNEGTLAHEVGHMLDHALDLKSKILSNVEAKKELRELAKERLSGKEVLTDKGDRIAFEDRVLEVAPAKYMEYIENDDEILANMYDAYVNSPELLQKKAPVAYKLFDDIIQNDPKLDFIRDIKPSLERAEETIEQDVWGPSDFAPQGTITVFREGKKEFYKVSPPLLEAMKNLSPVQMSATMRLLTAPVRASASILRAGATLIPEFWIRNVMRDQGTAFMQSSLRPTPIDAIKGLSAVIGKTDLYKDWMRNGGSFNSYMELDDRGLERAYEELLKPTGKLRRYATNPINILADISNTLEQATRVGVYGKAKRHGIVGLEAALMSREATLDFARGGTVAKQINQFVPFFNAGVQSVDKLVRTFKENPGATTFWGVATITVPSIILSGYYLYAAPDEERREYLEIPQWQKDLFWIFKDQSGEWRRVPKPFSFGYLFGSVPERFMAWGYAGDKPEIKDFWYEFVMGVGGTLSPVHDPSALLPPLIKVAIEDLTNYNFFTGRDIYPEWMDRLEPEKRTQKYTSETSRALGKIFDISPAVLDNTLRGQLAGSADYLTDASDFVLNSVREWNGEELPERPLTQADMAVVKAFTVREPTGYAANSVSNFFDVWENLQQASTTYNSLEGEEKSQYYEENQNLLRAFTAMKKYHKNIKELGKISNRIYEDKEMSSEEKVKALSENGGQILDIAEEANKWYNENIGD